MMKRAKIPPVRRQTQNFSNIGGNPPNFSVLVKNETQISEEPTITLTPEPTPTPELTPTPEPDAAQEPFKLDISDLTLVDAGKQLDTGDLKLQFGELLSVTYGGDGVIVVKSKIQSQLSNRMTIQQNYHSVEDLILNHGFDTCQELQYWAVADMRDGSESKVISFTLDKDLITAVASKHVVAIQLGDYVSDLWILPSLQN